MADCSANFMASPYLIRSSHYAVSPREILNQARQCLRDGLASLSICYPRSQASHWRTFVRQACWSNQQYRHCVSCSADVLASPPSPGLITISIRFLDSLLNKFECPVKMGPREASTHMFLFHLAFHLASGRISKVQVSTRSISSLSVCWPGAGRQPIVEPMSPAG
jgi:hypothetical protein